MRSAKKSMGLIGLAIFIFAVSATAAWMYFFNIYEVRYHVSKNISSPALGSIISVEAIPVNSFGYHALLRSSHSRFYIEEGEGLVEVVKSKSDEDNFVLRAKGEKGRIVILIKSKFSLLPTKIEVQLTGSLQESYS